MQIGKARIIVRRILPTEPVEFDGLPVLQLVSGQDRLRLDGNNGEKEEGIK
ncbi:MAG: hypothetical protein JNK38_00670 [Acidobacteria bacterium]|nr:hypothetical protein [Acidobacteriota bacterium]